MQGETSQTNTCNTVLETTPRLVLSVKETKYTPQPNQEDSHTGKGGSKPQNKGLKSFSQTKAKTEDQHPNSVLYSGQEKAADLSRMTAGYQETRKHTKYTDYSRYSQYFTRQQTQRNEALNDLTPTAHWEGLVSVQTYPRTQTLLVGYDAVLQCRDEGILRRDVFWQREGGRQLPAHSSQERGRLEILGVTLADEGDYECVAVGHQEKDGGKQVSTLIVEKR